MAVQTLLTSRAAGFTYFQGEATPDRASSVTGHFTSRMAVGEFCDADGSMPNIYSGGLITVRLALFSLTVTTGNVDFSVEIERLDPDGNPNNANNFAVAQSAADKAISATLSATTNYDIVFSQAQFDGVEGGDDFRARITRLAASATGDIYVKHIQYRSDL